MGYKYTENKTYIGFTTDTKPSNIDPNAILYEINATTKEVKKYRSIDGSDWYLEESSITMTSISNTLTSSIGGNGGQIISGTSPVTPSSGKVFIGIEFLADTTFTALPGNLTGTLTGITFPTGITICGRFTGLTLASGTVIAYEGV